MSNHPNRNKSRANNGANPTPEQIKAARAVAGLTQAEAGALVFTGCRCWQKWESGENRMHPSIWRDWQNQAFVSLEIN